MTNSRSNAEMNETIHGFVRTDHPLSPRRAFKDLSAPIRALVDYDAQTLWKQDTKSLPRALQKYRTKARDFAQSVIKPLALEIDLDPYGPKTHEVLQKAGKAGLLSDFLPIPLGSGDPLLMAEPIHYVASIKIEELCAACGGLSLMLGAHVLGLMPVLLSGRVSDLKNFILPSCRDNKNGHPNLFAFAITEPSAGSDVEDSDGALKAKPLTVAKRVSGGWQLNGQKVFISGGNLAKSITVFAALENEGYESWTCFLVDKNMPGFSCGRNELKMGQRASAATELIFEDVFVPDSHVIGGIRKGWAINRAVLNFSRGPVGAIALGIARGAMENAIQFVCTQESSGKKLIDYQEIQLAVAQMMIDTCAMRSMVWQTCKSWTPFQARASMTKVFCSDTAVKVCETAMELMGNFGFLHGNYAEKSLRDARLTQIYEGTNQINRLAITEDQMEELLQLQQ